MTEYLKPGDPGSFKDFTKVAMGKLREMSKSYGMTKLCPVCSGHGGWNLKLNAYPLPRGCRNTAGARHMFAHFRAQCGHCNGWGWVLPSDTCPGHVWVTTKQLGRCLRLDICKVCGATREVDSSD